MPRTLLLPFVLTLVALSPFALALPASAQPTEDGVRRKLARLRAENSVLREELRAIKAIVDGVEAKLSKAPRPALTRKRLKVGVVDVSQVFLRSLRRAALEKELKKARESYKARYQVVRLKAHALSQAAEELPSTTSADERARVEGESAEAAEHLKTTKQELEEALEAQTRAITLEVMSHIDASIGQFAKRYNYDLIFKADFSPKRTKTPQGEVRGRGSSKALLYSHPALDVTDALIAYVNASTRTWSVELGPLGLVVQVLEQAGVSFEGVRRREDLVIDCRVASRSLAEVALIRTSLRAPQIARHFSKLEGNRVEVLTEPSGSWLHFEIVLRSWRGSGPAAFSSLDRVIEHDTSGALGRVVHTLRQAGLEVKGHSATELQLSIRGPSEAIATFQTRDLSSSELCTSLQLRSIQSSADTLGYSRLELTLAPIPPRSAAFALVHRPAENVRSVARPGKNAISWSLSSQNQGIVITEIEVQVSVGQSGPWRPFRTLPPQAIGCTEEVNDAEVRRYRVVTRAKADADNPRVRGAVLHLAKEDQQRVSAPTAALRSP